MNVLVVDDEWLQRPAIANAIRKLRPTAVIAEAGSLNETFARLQEVPSTELIILDLRLTDSCGLETLKQTQGWCDKHDIAARIVVMSANEDIGVAIAVLQNEAAGFILKNGPSADFDLGVQAAILGMVHIPQHVAAALLNPYRPLPTGRDGALPDSFSPREREVGRLMAGGVVTYKELAAQMEPTPSGGQISGNTVRVYVNGMAQKLGIKKNRKAGVIAAMISLTTCEPETVIRKSDQ